MPGPRPKPTKLKELAGNPGKRPLNTREPIPRGDLRDAPDHLTPTQQASWQYAIDNAPVGLLKRLDRDVLAIWVIAADIHRDAAERLVKSGLLVKAPNTGLPIQSPYLPIVNKQAQIMLKAAAELGFTPASRSRIQLEDAPEAANPFAALTGTAG